MRMRGRRLEGAGLGVRLKEVLGKHLLIHWLPFPVARRPETIAALIPRAIDYAKELSDFECATKKKLTRRNLVVSVTRWGKLRKVIEPFYLKVEGANRPPIGLARKLRMYAAQK